MLLMNPFFFVITLKLVAGNILMYIFKFLDKMDQKETVPPTEEPYLGTIDIILLLVLLIGAAWWLLRRRNQQEVQPERSYSIQ